MAANIRVPDAWLHESYSAYRQYVNEWEREELERVAESGGDVEPPQPWNEFFVEYLYAELESCICAPVIDKDAK